MRLREKHTLGVVAERKVDTQNTKMRQKELIHGLEQFNGKRLFLPDSKILSENTKRLGDEM